MLPPFVPPAARAATEALPLITEFVLQRTSNGGAEPAARSGAVSSVEVPMPAPVQYGAEDLSVLPPITEFILRHAPEPLTVAPEETPEIVHHQEAPPPPPVMLQERRPAEVAGEPSSASEEPTPATPAADWVEAERNAFNWNAVAGLAATQNEELRAANDWAATDWDRPADSATDHIAAMLTQVARRVRAGELDVEGTRGMSAEAALAATLAALLKSEDR